MPSEASASYKVDERCWTRSGAFRSSSATTRSGAVSLIALNGRAALAFATLVLTALSGEGAIRKADRVECSLMDLLDSKRVVEKAWFDRWVLSLETRMADAIGMCGCQYQVAAACKTQAPEPHFESSR